MILYFAVLLLMFVPLAVTGQYLFAAIELAVALLVMGIYQWDAHRRRRPAVPDFDRAPERRRAGVVQ